MTQYDPPGTGACGWGNDGKFDNLIRLSDELMGPRSNAGTNPYCGKKVMITNGESVARARVVGKCPGCDKFAIGVSQAVYRALDGPEEPNTVEWHFVY
jgi:hypothetical protein